MLHVIIIASMRNWLRARNWAWMKVLWVPFSSRRRGCTWWSAINAGSFIGLLMDHTSVRWWVRVSLPFPNNAALLSSLLWMGLRVVVLWMIGWNVPESDTNCNCNSSSSVIVACKNRRVGSNLVFLILLLRRREIPLKYYCCIKERRTMGFWIGANQEFIHLTHYMFPGKV